MSETDYKFLIIPLSILAVERTSTQRRKHGVGASSIIVIKHIEERSHLPQNPNFKTPIPSRCFSLMENTAALGELEVLHDDNAIIP